MELGGGGGGGGTVGIGSHLAACPLQGPMATTTTSAGITSRPIVTPAPHARGARGGNCQRPAAPAGNAPGSWAVGTGLQLARGHAGA